jgi:molybdopterin/thiamine biosynthesis adenylyltransferase
MTASGASRYSRSESFPGIGAAGQERIGRSGVAFVGVGAVGTVAAEIAVRSGFGRVSLIDRDVVEDSNLQRQFLFDEADARSVSPKAEAAASRLARLNAAVDLRPVVADLDFRNAEELLSGHDVIVDGSDNFETRFLVSDAGKRFGIPTIYAACVGSEGLVAVSTPDPACPCLRCYLGALPAGGTGPTCETAGVVPALPPLVASLAMSEALRIAVGKAPSRGVLTLSVWEGDVSPVRAFASAGPTVSATFAGEGVIPRSKAKARRKPSSCAAGTACRWCRGAARVRIWKASPEPGRATERSRGRPTCSRCPSRAFCSRSFPTDAASFAGRKTSSAPGTCIRSMSRAEGAVRRSPR